MAGPTAAGKSEVALRLAERVEGEIIAVDSAQVYRGLDIGSAKPSLEERRRAPHHLIDVAELTARFDAAQFARLARAAAAEIQGRGRTPIFCGGTGLYFRALLDGVGCGPPGDPAVRAELDQLATEDLLRELRGADPALFQTIDPRNRRRLARALEVIRLTGRPFSEQRPPWRKFQARPPGLAFFVIDREPADLRRRIDARVEAMFARGWIEETRGLAPALAQNPAAGQALGYRQILEFLRGAGDLEATIERVKIRTRQFAKRQRTWFRAHAPAEWIRIGPEEPIASAAERVQARAEAAWAEPRAPRSAEPGA